MSVFNVPNECGQAREAFLTGNLAEAEGLLNRCLDAVPDDRESRFLRGVTLARRGNLAGAEADFLALVTTDTKDLDAMNNLAVIYGRQNKLQDALGTLLDAIDAEPTRVELHYNIGSIYKRLGKPQAAVMAYAKVAELEDGYVPAYTNLGIIQVNLEQYAKAGETFSRLLENHPAHGATQNNLGVALVCQGKITEALHCFRQALEANPPSAAAAVNLERASSPGEDKTAFLLDEEPEFLFVERLTAEDGNGESSGESPAELSSDSPPETEKKLSIPLGTALDLMRYLKAMTGGLPPKAREMFLRSDARLSMEYIIATLEGHTGLFSEIQDRSLAPKPSGREALDLAGTLDYLRKLAGALEDPHLSEALRRKADTVISELEPPL
ncbi:MAG: tetratricopeptide repeat protein [Spirochaetaceae bacterium]|jgi:Flp pilus assembly protein TadD|nr:tetratricopeptide repeat protein [Spirochaetaceae bacterium]